MKYLKIAVALFAVVTAGAACSRDDGVQGNGTASSSSAEPGSGTGGASASVPTTDIPSAFVSAGAQKTFDARRAFDLTGDGKPETIEVHARGPYADSADVHLVIRQTNGDTLYQDHWNTQSYFQYTPRKGLTDSIATSRVVGHLQRLLADSSFTSNGPSEQMKNAPYTGPPGSKPRADAVKGIDLEAVRYDTKASEAGVDSIANELKSMPTFTYFAGGEVTYAIAWSNTRKRFVKIFSCC